MNEFVFFSIYLILPAALEPGVYSSSNRNEYQKEKIMRPVRRADNLIAISEPTVYNVGSSTPHNPIGLHGLLRE
jgi:hypothetical protein